MRGDRTITAAQVARFYDEATDLISAELGGSLHFGLWRDALPETTMAQAAAAMTRYVADKLDPAPGARVLDLGCGSGRTSVDLVQQRGVRLFGVDVSPRQVALAKALAAAEGVSDAATFQQGDALHLPFPDAHFDAAWLFESFFHMPDQLGVLRGLARVLRPGARLVIANLVLRAPITDEADAALRTDWQVGHVAALHPLTRYPELLGAAGLVPVEVDDISDDSVEPTFAAIAAGHAANGLPGGGNLAERMDDGAGRLASTPEFGFAVVTANAPDRPSTVA